MFEGCDKTHRTRDNCSRPESEFHGGLRLLGHLLDLGCDPNTFHSSVSLSSMPAVLSAFDMGYFATVSTMIAHRADLTSFGPTPATLLDDDNDKDVFPWKLRTLRASGFSDWKVDTAAGNLLYGACWASALDEVLFALEVCGIDPNIHGGLDRAPVGNAAQAGFLQGITVLVEHGAEVNCSPDSWNGTPLNRSLSLGGLLTTTSHYLLSRGANPLLKDSMNKCAWTRITHGPFVKWPLWRLISPSGPSGWSYTNMEGGLTHLLLHNADTFEIISLAKSKVFLAPNPWKPPWYNRVQQMRTPDIFRTWSYALRPLPEWTGPDNSLSEGWIAGFERAEEARAPRFASTWSPSGTIVPGSSHTERTSSRRSRGEHDNQSTENTAASINRTVFEHSNNMKISSPGEGVDADGEDVSDSSSRGDVEVNDEYWEDSDDLDSDQEDFFRNATRFYDHISNEEGRRQLSRFPLVRALCDALQFAGYRAEMDDDGDIWFDADGDGDRYFDAREYQPAEDRDDWLVGECPICRDFEAYGLGHILVEVEEGKRRLREYREQINSAKRRYF